MCPLPSPPLTSMVVLSTTRAGSTSLPIDDVELRRPMLLVGEVGDSGTWKSKSPQANWVRLSTPRVQAKRETKDETCWITQNTCLLGHWSNVNEVTRLRCEDEWIWVSVKTWCRTLLIFIRVVRNVHQRLLTITRASKRLPPRKWHCYSACKIFGG